MAAKCLLPPFSCNFYSFPTYRLTVEPCSGKVALTISREAAPVSVLKIAIYFLSGLLIIGGVACIAIFFTKGSVQAIGGAVMFFCFGGAGVVLGLYLEQIVQAVRRTPSTGGRRTA